MTNATLDGMEPEDRRRLPRPGKDLRQIMDDCLKQGLYETAEEENGYVLDRAGSVYWALEELRNGYADATKCAMAELVIGADPEDPYLELLNCGQYHVLEARLGAIVTQSHQRVRKELNREPLNHGGARRRARKRLVRIAQSEMFEEIVSWHSATNGNVTKFLGHCTVDELGFWAGYHRQREQQARQLAEFGEGLQQALLDMGASGSDYVYKFLEDRKAS